MNLDDLRRLNLRDVGSWPMLPKAGALVLLFIAILAAGAFLDWKDQYETLNLAQDAEIKLRAQYTEK